MGEYILLFLEIIVSGLFFLNCYSQLLKYILLIVYERHLCMSVYTDTVTSRQAGMSLLSLKIVDGRPLSPMISLVTVSKCILCGTPILSLYCDRNLIFIFSLVFFFLSVCVGLVCSAIGYGFGVGQEEWFVNAPYPEQAGAACAA